ncbi:MAG: MBL fold metallo-hydrolase [Halioglobus sp.]
MKKSVVLLIGVLVIAAVAYTQRDKIALRIMAKGAEVAMTSNTTDDLPDGLHIALCGAGGPLPDPKRSGACVVVYAGHHLFVVDAGTNGLRNLVRMRYPAGKIEAVLLTHFHSDHIDGLGEMATIRWVNNGNTAPLPVIGPEGVQQVVEGFNTAYTQDSIYRHAHHGDTVAPLSGFGMVARPFPLPAQGQLVTVFDQDDVNIQAFAVDHDPVKPAVGYLFSYKDRTVLISGDTAKSANLQQFAEGVDLLVHEALSQTLVNLMHDTATKVGATRLAKITHDIVDYHATPVEAAEIARDAGVGHLLYYHIVPPLMVPGAEAAWLSGVADVFPDYTLGQDGTAFSLPAGSKDIILTADSM